MPSCVSRELDFFNIIYLIIPNSYLIIQRANYDGREPMRIKVTVLFFAANLSLMAAGWIAAGLAYPHLPEKIPLWLDFFNGQILVHAKSPLFFIYAASQTVFCVCFFMLTRFLLKKMSPPDLFAKELAYLALIFFNLIFIHVQTSLIFLAHHVEGGFNRYYFVMLIAVILMLIPYYRLRVKMLKIRL